MRWIATAFDRYPALGSGHAQESVIVAAESEGEAATVALAVLQDAWDDDASVGDRVSTVFVAPWDGRGAYRSVPATERAEFQCCAGGSENEYTGAGGHYSTCPHRPSGTGLWRGDA